MSMVETTLAAVPAPSAARQRSLANLQKFGWKKGQSGNPGGRTKIFDEFQRLLLKSAPDAVDELVKLTKSEDPSIKLAALHEFFDRLYGKAAQPIANGSGDGKPLVAIQILAGEMKY